MPSNIHVYGPASTPNMLTVVHHYPQGGKWYEIGRHTIPKTALSDYPGAISVDEANKLGIAHGNPVTPEHEHLLAPMAQEVKPPPLSKEDEASRVFWARLSTGVRRYLRTRRGR